MKRSAITYTCHAKPAALGGRSCGHRNTNAPATQFLGKMLVYCESCGRPKKASDDRQREASQP